MPMATPSTAAIASVIPTGMTASPKLELRGLFDLGPWQHELLIGTEYENFRKNERVTTIAGGPYAIDIYKPIYGQPKPDGARSGTDFFEHVESHALNLQDQIVFTDKLRGMIGARFRAFRSAHRRSQPQRQKRPAP
jgi:iron complex outermembrane receptor protein